MKLSKLHIVCVVVLVMIEPLSAQKSQSQGSPKPKLPPGLAKQIPTKIDDWDYGSPPADVVEGPIQMIHRRDSSYGIYFRAIKRIAEIYSILILEEVYYPSTNSPQDILSKREVDLREFQVQFNLIGEITGLRLKHWPSPTSLRFEIYGHEWELRHAERDTVTICVVR